MRTRSGIVALLVNMLFMMTGCPPKPLPPLLSPVEVLENEEGILSTQEVSHILQQRADAFYNLSGEGKVHIQTWEEKYKFSEVFLLETPDRFRLTTLGAFDQPALFLTSDGESLLLYAKKHNAYYQGIPSRKNLFKLSGINLPVEDTLLVLSGNLPRLSFITVEWGMPLPEFHQHYLERISLVDDTVQRIWFDTWFHTISYFEEYRVSDGKLILKTQFHEYRAEEGSYPIPTLISIDRPLDKTQVEVNYKFFDVNQTTIDQTLFTFIPPANAKPHFLDDATAGELEPLVPYEDFRTQE